MVITNIDGASNSANQFFDLLSLVSNPDAYSKKLQELQDATAEHKKYVEAVCPIADIIRVKSEADEDKKAAKNALNDANAKAQEIVDVANSRAKDIVDVANSKAKDITDAAQLLEATSKALMSAAQQASDVAAKAQVKADSDILAAQAKSTELDKAIADAEAAKKDAENTKALILAKHKAIIESL
jgi:F0F1-type ATP synthase membrane subunit b/b'